MKKFKQITSLILVLMFICVPVSGASQYKNIKVEISKAKIIIDGKTVKMDNFIYGGKTYVPLNDITKQLKSKNSYSKTKKIDTVTTFKKDLSLLSNASICYSDLSRILIAREAFIEKLIDLALIDNINEAKKELEFAKSSYEHYEEFWQKKLTYIKEFKDDNINTNQTSKLIYDDLEEYLYTLTMDDISLDVEFKLLSENITTSWKQFDITSLLNLNQSNSKITLSCFNNQWEVYNEIQKLV